MYLHLDAASPLTTSTLIVPSGHVTMISLAYSDETLLRILLYFNNSVLVTSFPTCIFYLPYITVHVFNIIRTPNIGLGDFKMLFSFHALNVTPQRLDEHLFNCSVNYYTDFRQHLDCNLLKQCHDGEDESQCPSCQGVAVRLNNKCYFDEKMDASIKSTSVHDFLLKANERCKYRGGTMAQYFLLLDVRALQQMKKGLIFSNHTCSRYQLGMFYGGHSVPNLYRHTWMGPDRSVIYNYNNLFLIQDETLHFGKLSCVSLMNSRFTVSFVFNEVCIPEECILCESPLQRKESNKLERILIPALGSVETRHLLVRCPDGHMTLQFLVCDPRANCGKKVFEKYCFFLTEQLLPPTHGNVISVQMFMCGDSITFIHFSLVCNLQPDCLDLSDESFCKHPECPVGQFTCNNGQCISYLKRGNLVVDCYDESDEAAVTDELYSALQFSSSVIDVAVSPPVTINFNPLGFFTKEKMVNESCPATHYRCPGRDTYCLPIYTRCNGYYDCEGREDEDGCEGAVCPGFYGCLDSIICLHPDHLCDEWSQCPHGDDEWLCDEKLCPEGCLCHGLSFICRQPFIASVFPQLRYLNGTESGMSLSALNSSAYLVHLVLAKCRIEHLPDLDLPNLVHLDLSFNKVLTLKTNSILRLTNLKTLVLTYNPLKKIYSEESVLTHKFLRELDLSHTELVQFSSTPFAFFFGMKVLNLSYDPIHEMSVDGFSYLPSLVEVDMTACPVKQFSSSIFNNLGKLQKVNAANYKLCCKAILPAHLDEHFCSAPEDEFSSCDDLLRSGGYSVFLWVVFVLSGTGNIFCLVFRVCVQRKATNSAFNVFVSSLGFADLLMGIYIGIIGAADVAFRGKYVLYEQHWTASSVCKAAGFISMLSSEVSALTIALITVDRCIVIRFPFSTLHFNRKTGGLVAAVTWMIGIILAAIPLLPLTSHWEFYSQTGICIPLAVTRQDFKGRGYAFGVLIAFNFVLFLFIAIGQAVIYRSVQKNAMVTETTKKSQDITIARRLITVAVTDFLCWFPIGACSVLALSGIPIPGEVNVAMAILVMPLNAALNPFLYTFNLVMEKRRKAFEEKFLSKLKIIADLEHTDKTLLE